MRDSLYCDIRCVGWSGTEPAEVGLYYLCITSWFLGHWVSALLPVSDQNSRDELREPVAW